MNLKEFVAVLLALFLAFSFGFTLDHFTTWTGPKELFGNVAASSFEVHTLQDVSWTTTADFDSGTKSGPTDGNLEVETISDNLGIGAGAIELSSIKGEDFDTADTDADTFKWNPRTSITSGSCFTRTISSGTLKVRYVSGDSTSVCGVNARTTISGTLDARVRIRNVDQDSSTFADFALLNEDIAGWSASGTVDGVLFRVDCVVAFPCSQVVFRAYTITDGVLSNVGNSAGLTDDPFRWARITRSGTAVNFYYSDDGLSWTTLASPTFATTDALWPSLSSMANAGGRLSGAEMDDFLIASGNIDGTGFRTSGSWRSPEYTVSGTTSRIDEVIISHPGVTATAYIDRVEFLRNQVLIQTFGDDVTSGTETTFITTTLIESNSDFAVVLYLVSDGDSTMTVDSIQVFEHETTLPLEVIDLTFLWVLIVLFLVVLAIGLWRSPLFLILAGLLGIILVLAVDVELMDGRDDLTRYGVFLVLIAMSVVLFAQGALNLRKEFEREAA